jgi:hypothetical protein
MALAFGKSHSHDHISSQLLEDTLGAGKKAENFRQGLGVFPWNQEPLS